MAGTGAMQQSAWHILKYKAYMDLQIYQQVCSRDWGKLYDLFVEFEPKVWVLWEFNGCALST